ncbi:DUF4145 domain-containing protein [Xanthomonas floridensis]|uniref:DUF4145 domain-containing protein n=2 Tax=Xanthomonas floridensis TaxID=1843580 RepID=A0A1A9MC99_9XANT|nr:DUF4145 domain-containing protein [Xanthomonas floridensis]MEA5123292.1 DUF4145 domain-containing protein [Xanthomonas floridensis]MEA5132741.1 DUF4145 domain-containing protein [Xanthomonas floridensis]OAG67691.1 hypothetical protein A7D17_16005 [Xanthomonas floridensis]
MAKHYPPKFRERSFHCARCTVYALQKFTRLPHDIHTGDLTRVWTSKCAHCGDYSYWWQQDTANGYLLMPQETTAPPANESTPEAVRAVYDEAVAIFDRSPRGAAALLRLAVQLLMVDLGQPGKHIESDIKALVKEGLPVLVQQALDYCRVVGNNSVHPGTINLDDAPEMAMTMFEMINFIVQDRIAAPAQLQAMYELLPEGARDAIAKRDGKAALVEKKAPAPLPARHEG